VLLVTKLPMIYKESPRKIASSKVAVFLVDQFSNLVFWDCSENSSVTTVYTLSERVRKGKMFSLLKRENK